MDANDGSPEAQAYLLMVNLQNTALEVDAKAREFQNLIAVVNDEGVRSGGARDERLVWMWRGLVNNAFNACRLMHAAAACQHAVVCGTAAKAMISNRVLN